jgi:hypothetical protein
LNNAVLLKCKTFERLLVFKETVVPGKTSEKEKFVNLLLVLCDLVVNHASNKTGDQAVIKPVEKPPVNKEGRGQSNSIM